MCQEFCPQGGGSAPPQEHTPPLGADTPWSRPPREDPPWEWPVCILLKCILVIIIKTMAFIMKGTFHGNYDSCIVSCLLVFILRPEIQFALTQFYYHYKNNGFMDLSLQKMKRTFHGNYDSCIASRLLVFILRPEIQFAITQFLLSLQKQRFYGLSLHYFLLLVLILWPALLQQCFVTTINLILPNSKISHGPILPQ